jgi:DNA-binding response OmpR family regulator
LQRADEQSAPARFAVRAFLLGRTNADQTKEHTLMPASHILLVEDDTMLRGLLLRNLAARGHNVHLATDAQSALSALRRTSFQLVILDINLPDHTGWEILRTAQREGWVRPRSYGNGQPKLPVVVVSAVRVSLARLREFALLAYLPKPFPLDALLRLVKDAGQEGEETPETAAQPAERSLEEPGHC